MSNRTEKPILRRLTGEGAGAIAVLSLSGPGALELASREFRPYKGVLLSETSPDCLRVGRMGSGLGDEVVAVWRGERPFVEIQCHGGPAAVSLVSQALLSGGATLEESCQNDAVTKAVTIEEQAALDLAKAPTLRSAGMLLEQCYGALRRSIESVIDAVDCQDFPSARTQIQALLSHSEIGTRLLTGWRVVLAGRPNVGKSRLLNTLAGYHRSIVSGIPGTTRDLVTVRTAIEGWPVSLTDTAGLRESSDVVERHGVRLAREAHAQADLVLLLLDSSSPLVEEDHQLLAEYPNALVVRTKCDLPPMGDWPDLDYVAVSAETGSGIEDLIRRVAGQVLPVVTGEPMGIPFRAEHRLYLEESLRTFDEEGPQPAASVLKRWLQTMGATRVDPDMNYLWLDGGKGS